MKLGAKYDNKKLVVTSRTHDGRGRVLQGTTRLEHAEFSYDTLGHRTGMTRYKDADAGALPVTSSWHFDSLGQMTDLDEPDSVPQLNTYSDWGELLQTSRRVTSAGGTQITRSVASQYTTWWKALQRELEDTVK